MHSLKGKTLIYKRWETLETLQHDFKGPDFIISKNLKPVFENNRKIFEYDGWNEPGNSKLMLFDKEYESLQKEGYFIGEFWVLILKDE